MTTKLEVLDPGPSTTLQDLGRVGHGHLGVGPSGAADRGAAALANRLVGNPDGVAVLEVTAGGLAVRASADVVVATAGAPATILVDGHPAGHRAPLVLARGVTLTIGSPTVGLRTYLAVRGGFDVAPVLGSRATDLLGGLGPRPLRRGDRLAVGSAVGAAPLVEQAAAADPPGGTVELPLLLGPRDDWFADAAIALLREVVWTARADSNRTGVRLDGPTLERRDDRELPTEGLVRGALQVPPSGPPTLFLADHPVTGGYPVVGVVLSDAVDRAAQVRPGQPVRFLVRERRSASVPLGP